MRRIRAGRHPGWVLAGLALILLAVWELTTRAGWIGPIILPAPGDIVAAALLDGDRFLAGLAQTAGEIALAVAIAWSLGIGIGLACGARASAAAVAGPLLTSLFAVPLIILYPLLVAWIGIGPSSKVLFGVISGILPIALATLSGVAQSDPAYALMARAMGAGRLQVFLRVRLPLALPAVISGLRIGTALCAIGVLVTEMLASLGGLGYLISYHRTLFDTGHVYLGIIMALTLVLAIYAGLTWLERRFERWRAP